jgi:hypothetical protein
MSEDSGAAAPLVGSGAEGNGALGGDETGNVALMGAGDGGAGAAAGDAGAFAVSLALPDSSPEAVSARMRRNASGARETFEPANSRNAPGSP